MQQLLCALILVYILVLLARALLSWFPIRPGTTAASIASILYEVTEPVLGPVRRIIPPVGGLDLSILLVTFGLFILQGVVCS